MKTRYSSFKSTNVVLIYQLEPKKVNEYLGDVTWVNSIKEKLEQLEKSNV